MEPGVFLLNDLFRESAGTWPGRLAVAEGNDRLSYAELDRQSGTLAAALQRTGVARGDRVAVMIDNSVGAAVAAWATLKAGAVLVPVNPESKPFRVRAIVADCGASMLIAPGEAAAAVAEPIGGLPIVPRVVWLTPPEGRGKEPSLPAILAGPVQNGQHPGRLATRHDDDVVLEVRRGGEMLAQAQAAGDRLVVGVGPHPQNLCAHDRFLSVSDRAAFSCRGSRR